MRPVVDEGEGMVGVAVRAEGRLGDAAALDLDGRLQVTDGASEEGRVDLGNQVRSTDDHTGDGDQLINIWMKKR